MIPMKKLVVCLLSPCLIAVAVTAAAPAEASTLSSAWSQSLRGFWEQEYRNTLQILRAGPRCEPGKNPDVLDEQSLTLTADRDPLDVQLRRSKALLANLRNARTTPTNDLGQIAKQLDELAARLRGVGEKRRQLISGTGHPPLRGGCFLLRRARVGAERSVF